MDTGPCFNITIVGDKILEENEKITFDLDTDDDTLLDISDMILDIIILNDDSKFV